jgi:hypothetical protein
MARRFLPYWVAGSLACGLATASPAGAAPNTNCVLTTPVQEVRHFSELPAELRSLLTPVADIGAPFNSTDAVNDPNLPFRRLIRAGNRGSDWFVWYEHGGLGYFWQAVIARVTPGSPPTVLADAGTVSDTLCTVTDGVYAGRVPPYPSGTWEASAL